MMTLVFGFLLALTAGAADVALYDRESSVATTIAIPSDASPSQRYAAEEFSAYLAKMTGERPLIVSNGTALVRLVTADPSENLGEDGFTLRVREGALEIRGSRVRGCLYGVYETLERFGGCRWYTSSFEKIPKVSRLAVPGDLNHTERPAFAMRQAWWYDVIQHPLFAAKLKLNGFNHTELPVPEKIGGDSFRFGGGLSSCHTFYALMPPEKYFEDHPEYFSLVGGRRVVKEGQLCLTNPEVLRIVTQEVLARIRSDPGARFYGVSQNDWQGYCECPACAAVDAEEESHAGTMVRFVNAIAEAVEKEFPDVLIETLAYQYTRKAPKLTRYRRNVVPCLCTHGGDIAHPYATASYPFNAAFRDDIVKYKNQGRELYVWDYATLFGGLPSYCPDTLAIAPNIRFFRDNNVKELFMQGCGAGVHAYLDALKVWLLAKLMWNPDQDERTLIREFTDAYYGAAAALVREDIEATCGLFTPGPPPIACECEEENPLQRAPDAFFAESRARLMRALKAVEGHDDFAFRVRSLLFSLDFTELERLRDGKYDESTWTAADRACATACARRILAFLAETREPVKLSYHDRRPHKALIAAWKRLAGEESFGDLERREYLRPTKDQMSAHGLPIFLAEGDGEGRAPHVAPIDGTWSLTLQDGRVIPAAVPGSIYADLWKAGVTGNPYFGTNDLFAATFSSQTNVYRCTFAWCPKAGARYRLAFGGVSDQAEISLNGKVLGRHLGMFEGFEYELEAASLRPENVLEVKLFPIRVSTETLSCIITRGQHYCNLPSVGIWRPVTLTEIPSVEVRRQFVVTKSAQRREIDYRVDLVSDRNREDWLRLTVRPSGFKGKSYTFSRKVSLARGENVFRYAFELPDAELWWPLGYGRQCVYEMTASFGTSSLTDAFGIRTFRFDPGPDGAKTNLYNRVAVVNDRKLFLKGAGWCICDALLRFDESQYRRMFDRAVEQGVNFFRAWGNGLVETDEFYRLCDRAGILVLQEFPIPWYHSAEAIREPIFDMARRSVVRLRNHPSLAVWGGGNELCHNPDFTVRDEVVNTVGRICCELDGTRDFWRTDPYAGSEHHHISWSGWTPDAFLRHYADKEGVCQNEYGLDTLMNVETLRRISGPEEHEMFPWRHFTAMAHHTATFNYDYIVNDFMRPKGKDVENHVWFGSLYLAQTNLQSFVLSSQIAQVYATAYHAYNARTQFPKTGMYTYYKLNDVYPGSSWAVVDWFGSPKLAHAALKRAQRPLCAAPRLAGHEFGWKARIPFYLLDDAGELGETTEWAVFARLLDRDLQPIAERRFSGRGSVGQVRFLGDFDSDPNRPLTSPSVLTWRLECDGRCVGSDFVMLNVFDNPKKCAGFASTSLALTKKSAGCYEVVNKGRVAAVGVLFDLGETSAKAVLDDNFFFLDAGECRAVHVSDGADVKAVSALNAKETSE